MRFSFSLLTFSNKLWITHLTLYSHICKFIFYTMNKVLDDNTIIFYFCYHSYNSKKLECQEEIKKKVIKLNEQEEIVNVNNDKANVNEEINFAR